MNRPSSAFLGTSKTPRLVSMMLTLIAVTVLTLSVDSWSQTKPAAPSKTKTQAAPAKKSAAPKAKAPGWCKNAAPVTNGVATVTISPVGSTTNLKVDYNRACIGATDKIEWKWAGDASKDWSVEFYTGANPFPKNKYGKGSPQSDNPNATPNDYLIYKYVIHVESYKDLDPDVIIRGSA